MELAILVVLVIFGGAVAASFAARARFARAVDEEVTSLFADLPSQPAGVIDVVAETADLPPPVQRYLRGALGKTTPRIGAVRYEFGGHFRLQPGGAVRSMESREFVRVDRPGYLWHAQVRVAPLVWADVRDFYVDGHGAVLGRLNSTVTIAAAEAPEVAQGALIRWASEAAWFPQAFLNREVFTWRAMDERTALLEVRDHGLSATFECRFHADGRLERLTTQDRSLQTAGGYQRRPFTASFEGWHREDGIAIPSAGTATWQLPDGAFEYARLEVRHVQFGFEPERPASAPSRPALLPVAQRYAP